MVATPLASHTTEALEARQNYVPRAASTKRNPCGGASGCSELKVLVAQQWLVAKYCTYD